MDSDVSLTAPELAGAVDAEFLFAEVTVSYNVNSQQTENTVTATYDAVADVWNAELNVLGDTEFTLDVTWYDMLDEQGRRADLSTSSTTERSGNVGSSLTLSFEFSDYDDAQFDADSDGVSNLEERENGTNPFVAEQEQAVDTLVAGEGLLLLAINEGEARNIDFPSDLPVREVNWIAQEYEAENNGLCHGESQYDVENSATHMFGACGLDEACTLQMDLQESSFEYGVRYSIKGPEKLKASIPLAYELHLVDSAFETTVYPVLLCLGAENLAPTAVNDTYVVLAGSTEPFTVPEIGFSLLGNDSDDNHVGNQPLAVETTAVQLPANSSAFTLESDGSFSYQYDGDASSVGAAGVSDSFAYRISDGTSSSSATVNLSILTSNQAAVLTSPIPTLIAPLGVEVEFDLAAHFEDPEGGTLWYEFVGGSNGLIFGDVEYVFSSSGAVSVMPFYEASIDQHIDFLVSDGQNMTQATLFIEVVNNENPIASAIPDNVIDVGFEQFNLDVSGYFSDPEGHVLNYSLTSEPAANVSINQLSGVIAGLFPDAGVYELTVTVEDRSIGSASSSFFVTVE